MIIHLSIIKYWLPVIIYHQEHRINNNDEIIVASKFTTKPSIIEFKKVINLNHINISRVIDTCKIKSDLLFYNVGMCDLSKYAMYIQAPMDKLLIRSYINMIVHLDIKPDNNIIFSMFLKRLNKNLYDITFHLYSPPEALLHLKKYYSYISIDALPSCYLKENYNAVIINNNHDLCKHSSWKGVIPIISPRRRFYVFFIDSLHALSHPYVN